MKGAIGVGLVGYGMASKRFHAPLITAQEGLSLVAVASRDAAKVRADLPDVPVEATPEALFARDDIDLVVIPTPNATHFELASQALAAGKHVVIDKPFTVTVAQAEQLCAQAEKSQRLLSVFHNRRWDADFLTVRNLIDSRSLGDVVHFESHFDRFRPQVAQRWREEPAPGAGAWFDLGAHLVDQALVLFGRPQSIWLDLANQRDGALVDDYFHAVLRYADKRVILHGGTLVSAPSARFTVHGTRASYLKHGLDPQEDLLKRGDRQPAPHWGEDWRHGMLTIGQVREGSQPELHEVPTLPGDYPAFYSGVRDAILGRAPLPVTADEALQVMKLLEAGARSATTGTAVEL
ncbi:oxidoreductase [Salinicola rhizosphaerae]|uniref:Oxidoreductase n=1 Tax=Salinicola rhizosphaerae TaxID=1443141 RepID=A0ABQ3E4V6_9GAMM|nr:oxidoreductase [Salinicola rhizosphaerae]GHB25129.1 oxidoreductase [Salinicola rhizosphaerae]